MNTLKQFSPKLFAQSVLRPFAIAITASVFYLAGCAGNFDSTAGTISTAGQKASGSVHGGQQPVGFATVTLMAPGTTGYGSASTVIVSTTTDANGNFTLPRPYTCPANSGLVYALSTGGNPGAGTNSAIALAAVVGSCGSLTASTFINIDEVTTVAAAYALAPFASVSSGSTGIGTSSTNLLGLSNANGPAANLADTSTGLARAANAVDGMTLPTAEINTLADILAACVNTTGPTGGTTPCDTLFSAATPPGGSAPTDTFQAALDIALNPGQNAATLFGLASSTAPFQPTLTSAPTDFAVAIVYTGGSLATAARAGGIDIDKSGNAWVAVQSPNSVTEITPSGTFPGGSSGFLSDATGSPQVPSIDNNGNVWLTLTDSVAPVNVVAKLGPTGSTEAQFSPASLSGPLGIAFDNRTQSIWVSDYSGSPYTRVTHTDTLGQDLNGSPFTSGQRPVGIAMDASGNSWVANSNDASLVANADSITKFTPATGVHSGTYTQQTFAVDSGSAPYDLAIDNLGYVWASLVYGIGKYSNSTGAAISPALGYQSNPHNIPFSVSIDGLGRAWASNSFYLSSSHTPTQPGSVTVFSNSGTLLSTSDDETGYEALGTLPYDAAAPRGIVIDGSGNVWVTGTTGSTAKVVELIGAAAPVTTPLSVAASTNVLGTRP